MNRATGIPQALTQKLQNMAKVIVPAIDHALTPKREEAKIQSKIAEFRERGTDLSDAELRRRAKAMVTVEQLFNPSSGIPETIEVIKDDIELGKAAAKTLEKGAKKALELIRKL